MVPTGCMQYEPSSKRFVQLLLISEFRKRNSEREMPNLEGTVPQSSPLVILWYFAQCVFVLFTRFVGTGLLWLRTLKYCLMVDRQYWRVD